MTSKTSDTTTAELLAAELRASAPETLMELALSLRGHVPPVAAQLVAVTLPVLAHSTSAHLGSREYKSAVRALFAATGIPISLTRSDIAHGARFLHVNGLLPAWVRTEGIGGAHENNS